MKDEAALNQFLRSEVNLNKSRYDAAKDRLEALDRHLKQNLDGFDGTEIQGSYATETIIKPVDDNDEYDIDRMVYVRDDGSDPEGVVSKLEECLSERSFYKDHMKVRKRSIQITYANKFKIDVVPCVVRNGSKWVCNSEDNTWEITDGSGYKCWFLEQSRKSNGHLKRVTRLLKYLRDHKNTFTVRSIALTTLAGMAVEATEPERLNTLPNSLEAITEWIDGYLQVHPSPDLRNPALPEEDFNRHWTDVQYQNFRKMFHRYTERIKEAIECQDSEKSEKLWQGIFGPKYRRSNPGNNSQAGGGGRGPSPPESTPPSRRGASTTRRAAVISTLSAPNTFRPPPPHAVTQTPLRRARHRHDLTPLSKANVNWLAANQPGLTYSDNEGLILGVISIHALWDSFAKNLTVNPVSTHDPQGYLIRDEFHVSIQLRYDTRWIGTNPVIPGRHPRVSEVGGRALRMARDLNVPLADLHMFPSGECCLGFNVLAPDSNDFNLPKFIEQDVISWLYRLAFVERFGLSMSESILWPAYDHVKGPGQYLMEISKIASACVSGCMPCPCGIGKEYRQCHMEEVEQCRRDGLLRRGEIRK